MRNVEQPQKKTDYGPLKKPVLEGTVTIDRLEAQGATVEDLSLKEVPGRLAAYLAYLSEQHEGTNDLVLGISKTQLASILGTIPETLSRILGRLVKEGIIESDGHSHVQILNRVALEKIASGEIRLSKPSNSS